MCPGRTIYNELLQLTNTEVYTSIVKTQANSSSVFISVPGVKNDFHLPSYVHCSNDLDPSPNVEVTLLASITTVICLLLCLQHGKFCLVDNSCSTYFLKAAAPQKKPTRHKITHQGEARRTAALRSSWSSSRRARSGGQRNHPCCSYRRNAVPSLRKQKEKSV